MPAGRRTIFGHDITKAIATPTYAVNDSSDRLQRKHVIERHGKNDELRVRKTFRISDHCTKFCIDSGSTIHGCKDYGMFSRFYAPPRRTKTVLTASGEPCKIEGIGEIDYAIENDAGDVEIHTLKNCYYIPDFSDNVLSVRMLWKYNKISCTFRDDLVLDFHTTGSKVIVATDGKDYELGLGTTFRGPDVSGTRGGRKSIVRRINALFRDSKHQEVSDETIHARMGHCHSNRIIRTAATSRSKRLRKYRGHADCESCAANSRKKSFHTSSKHVWTYVGERVHSDLCGPFPASAAGGFRYVLCFVDAYSKYAAIYFLRDKKSLGVQDALERFLVDHKHVFKRGVTEWFCDNGGEFCSDNINEYCHEISVRRQYSVPYCPPQNGTAERLWGLLLHPMRCIFHASRVPRTFWPECMEHCCQLHNALSKNKGVSPLEKAGLRAINHDKFRVWGCKVYYHVPHIRYRVGMLSKKLADTAVLGIHLGCDALRPGGYKVFLPQLNKIVSAYHLKWFENKFCNIHRTVPNVRNHEGELVDSDFTRLQKDIPGEVEDDDDVRDINNQDENIIRPRHVRRKVAPILPDIIAPDREFVDPGDAEVNVRSGKKPGQFAAGICDVSGCDFKKHPRDTLHSFQTPVPGSKVPVGNVSTRTRRHVTFSQARKGRHAFKVSSTDDVVPVLPEDERNFVLFPEHQEDCFTLWYSENNHSRDEVCFKLSEHGPIPIPLTAAQALAGPMGPRWKKAMDDEITKLMGLKAWKVESRSVPRKQGRRVTGSRWVFDVKYNKDGTLKKLKARFVVKGFTQQEGVDYERSFSSTLRASSFRTFLAISAGRKFPVRHLDVTNAFVQASLDDVDLWIEPPQGYADYEDFLDDKGNPITKVCKLQRALYGTKQASRLFSLKLSKYLQDNNFISSPSDPCIYHKKTSEGEILLGTYVDDIIVAFSDRSMYDRFEKSFAAAFDCTPSESLSWFLGIGIEQIGDNNDCIAIHQEKYIEDMVKRFVPGGASNSIMRKTPVSTDLLERCGPTTSDAQRDYMRTKPYMELVGSLLWVATMSRPDIAYHMSILCKYMSDQNQQCYESGIQLLLYLYATRRSCIVYGCDGDKENYDFHAYSDASWSTPHPMAGYVVKINGGVVSYAAKKLKVVAASSCEAEYAACTMCAHDVTFVREVCNDLGFEIKGTIPIFVDNKACITLCEDVKVSSKNKHFLRAIHYIREQVQDLQVKCIFVRAEAQMADGMTKPVAPHMFIKCQKYMLNIIRST